MLDIDFIRENPEAVKEGAAAKNRQIDTAKILELDKKARDLRLKIEGLRSKRNKVAEKKDIEAGKKIKTELGELEQKLVKIEPELNNLLRQIPNLPAKDVKIGKDESENEVIKKWGKPRKFDFEPRDHIELGKINQMLDIERAAKASGARFYYLTGLAVELEMALIQFGFNKLKKKGFRPVIPPSLISEKAMRGMGYLEHGEDAEIYHLPKDNLYLIGTSEQAIGAMHMDELLNTKELPLRYAGFSSCYRREAGSYGKDTRGILRTHQFDKVEMFVFCRPEESEKEHQKILAVEEEIMQDLSLPYQVIKMCTGDLGLTAAKKYDIEAWFPTQGKYRETHSTSNCTDFQARRLNTRYKNPQTNKNEFVHMLNGTAIAIGRTLIALMENYQQKNGSIKIPEVLKKYLLS